MTTLTQEQPLKFAAGDILSPDEFLRRWELMPWIKKAELIRGRVYMAAALKAPHGDSDSILIGWLIHYVWATPVCTASSNATCFIGTDIPQPDSHLRLLPEYGGKCRLDDDDYIHGPPELIIEICNSSAAYDLNVKKELYCKEGVAEYITVLLQEREIRWHRLIGGQYQLLELPPDGILRSAAYPGLWLDTQAFLKNDLSGVMTVLDEGLKSGEHAEFISRLQARGKN